MSIVRLEQVVPTGRANPDEVRASVVEYFDSRGFPVNADRPGEVRVTADTSAFLAFRFDGNGVTVISETDKEIKTKGLLERGIEIVKKYNG